MGVAAKKDMVRVGRRQLTPKQAKFVRGIAEGKPGYKAALEAYDTDDINVADTISSENLRKPTVRAAVDDALRKLKITPEKAVEPIAKALRFHHDNPAVELDMRLKGSDRALRLIGAHQPDDTSKGNSTFNFNIGNTFIKNDNDTDVNN